MSEGKSNKKLLIIVLAAVVVGGLAFFMLKGGEDGWGGEAKQAFLKGCIDNFSTSYSGPGGGKEGAEKTCNCITDKLEASISKSDLVAMGKGKASPEAQAKMNEVTTQCVQQMIQSMQQ